MLRVSMQAVISFRARGKGAFALRKELKAKVGTVCDVRRSPTNEFGMSLAHLGDMYAIFESCRIHIGWCVRREINCFEEPSFVRIFPN